MTCDPSLCCLGCLALIPTFRRRVVNAASFFPPQPAGYVTEGAGAWRLANGEKMDLLGGGEVVIEVHNLTVKARQTTPAVLLRHMRREDVQRRWLIIHSHGNSTDLGHMFGTYCAMVRFLGVDLLAYEYRGYGPTLGRHRTSESGLYRDAAAAYRFAVDVRGYAPERVVMYGQSLGSAPAVKIAATCKVGGLILHSPMRSGLTVFKPRMRKPPWFDVFKNHKAIGKVKCPVFVIHGTEDQEIDVTHGQTLYRACAVQGGCWWVRGAGHNDIEALFLSEWLSNLRHFLKRLRETEERRTLARAKGHFLYTETLLATNT